MCDRQGEIVEGTAAVSDKPCAINDRVREEYMFKYFLTGSYMSVNADQSLPVGGIQYGVVI